MIQETNKKIIFGVKKGLNQSKLEGKDPKFGYGCKSA